MELAVGVHQDVVALQGMGGPPRHVEGGPPPRHGGAAGGEGPPNDNSFRSGTRLALPIHKIAIIHVVSL